MAVVPSEGGPVAVVLPVVPSAVVPITVVPVMAGPVAAGSVVTGRGFVRWVAGSPVAAGPLAADLAGLRASPARLTALGLSRATRMNPVQPSPPPVPKVTVRPRPPAPPKGVTARRGKATVPRVVTERSPSPKVSISMPAARRPALPKVTLPHVTVYRDGLCAGGVTVGECPRTRPRAPQRAQPAPVILPTPEVSLSPTPTPTPTLTPSIRSHVKRAMPPARRENPLGTLLVMVVVVTAIASTAAVAFGARR
ncbi:hypothetical protein ACFOY2_08365 [Nonomuraea purpurea]|uniref:Uncharacterized protein n=1 Tax=Nonomuraea purpurea TaxID=1849276 RepID=A0ABV8FZT9_9ACTN